MKKQTILVLSTMLTASLIGFATQACAEQTITGDPEGRIRVDGSIGEFDSETPGPDPEDINKWINVTMPTTAIFYSRSSDSTQLASPEYKIINNSARGVTVNVAQISHPTDIDVIDSLSIGDIEFISDGAVSLNNEETLFTLQNNQSGSINDRVGQFQFIGQALEASDNAEVNPSFDIVFKFIPGAE